MFNIEYELLMYLKDIQSNIPNNISKTIARRFVDSWIVNQGLGRRSIFGDMEVYSVVDFDNSIVFENLKRMKNDE